MIEAQQYRDKIDFVLQEIGKAVMGKDMVIRHAIATILAKGHILLEDIPGVGKTTLAMALSKALGLKSNRMQFTPDVMPGDVIGFPIVDGIGGEMRYRPGAIMCNLFLADEINRTSPKTQSALLEVMEEGKVTVDGVTREVPKPFHVIATQNPVGSAGTQMLPESQLDRFMVRLSMGYPNAESEIEILKGRSSSNPLERVGCAISREDLIHLQSAVSSIFVHDIIYEYIAKIVQKTRTDEMSELGVSPRGALAVINMAKAVAIMEGRGYLIPDDIKEVLAPVVLHRIILKPKARLSHLTPQGFIEKIIQDTPEPKLVRN